MSVALAVLASVCLGVQTLLVQRGLSGGRAGGALAAAALTLVTSVSVLWAVVLLRRGVPAVPAVAVVIPFVAAGVLDPAFTRVCYYEGIDRLGPTVASAITAGSPAVAAVVAIPVLGERLTPVELLGLGLVVAGVVVLQFVRPASDELAVDAVKRELVGASVRDSLFPVAATLLLAVAFVVVKVGLSSYSDTLVATAVTQTAALVTLAPVAARSANARAFLGTLGPRPAATLSAAGVVVAAGWYAMFLALDAGTVTTVLPVVSTYPLVVVAATYALAREVPRSPALLGAILAIVGGAALVQSV